MPYPLKKEVPARTAGIYLQRGARKKTFEATREFLKTAKIIDEYRCPCCKSLFYFPSSDHVPLETVPCPGGCKDSYAAYWEDDFPEENMPVW